MQCFQFQYSVIDFALLYLWHFSGLCELCSTFVAYRLYLHIPDSSCYSLMYLCHIIFMTSDSWTSASSFKILEITVCLAKSLVHNVTHKINNVLIMILSDLYVTNVGVQVFCFSPSSKLSRTPKFWVGCTLINVTKTS